MCAWPIPQQFADGLTSRGQQRICRADVLRDGQVILTGLPVVDGSVKVSSSSSPRRTMSCTIIDNDGDMVPADADDPLAVYGNEIALYRGLRVTTSAGSLVPGSLVIDDDVPTIVTPDVGETTGSGSPTFARTLTSVDYLAPLGVFRIDTSASATTGGAVTVAVTGSDRSVGVSSDPLIDYLAIPDATEAGGAITGVLATDAIHRLIDPALPIAQAFAFTPSTAMIGPLTYEPGTDRWATASDIAASIGCLLFFDPVGTCCLIPVPDPATAPTAWTFAPGQASVLTGATKTLDRTQAANVVIVTAQGSGVTPIQAIARDDNPDSPTYYLGRFGSVVKTITTSLVTDADSALAYAQSQLLLLAGATQQVALTAIVLPHLDAFDVITAQVPQVKLSDRFVIDQLDIPLGSGTLSLTTRGQLA